MLKALIAAAENNRNKEILLERGVIQRIVDWLAFDSTNQMQYQNIDMENKTLAASLLEVSQQNYVFTEIRKI